MLLLLLLLPPPTLASLPSLVCTALACDGRPQPPILRRSAQAARVRDEIRAVGRRTSWQLGSLVRSTRREGHVECHGARRARQTRR